MYSIFNPHNDAGMTAAKISFDAKYIVTVGNENCQLLKIWTPGKDIADGQYFYKKKKKNYITILIYHS